MESRSETEENNPSWMAQVEQELKRAEYAEPRTDYNRPKALKDSGMPFAR
jgi:hypothetical protein